ncbi:hypothetical protein CY34DRAFT_801884 [Suillus luteus UH-Slu-Lm8-n1]|uniref:Uncharacterized protein n=1 Tax=Suillus luteus UH-Slu-Lm8-n1 TaxID=930992 RepID=A0A0D0BGK1_9AGAM|nr:hypothetical protein CY34DRAFT_801884 [Suillus luteus UH-Slu-Lm8-n1]
MDDFQSDCPPSNTTPYILYSVDTDTSHYGEIRHQSMMDCASPTGDTLTLGHSRVQGLQKAR